MAGNMPSISISLKQERGGQNGTYALRLEDGLCYDGLYQMAG